MSWFSDLTNKISREAAQVNNNIVNQWELARTGQTGETRVAWRIERAEAIERVRDAMIISGYSKAEIESAERAIFDQWNSTLGAGWQKALEQNVREYGKEAGALFIAAGSALQGIPGIGTVIGIGVGGAGIGLVMTSQKQASDFARKQEIFAGIQKLQEELKQRLGENPLELVKELDTDFSIYESIQTNKFLIDNCRDLVKEIRKHNEKLAELNSGKISQSESLEKEKNVLYIRLEDLIKQFRTKKQILENSIKPVEETLELDSDRVTSDQMIKEENERLKDDNKGEIDKDSKTEIKPTITSRIFGFITYIKTSFFKGF